MGEGEGEAPVELEFSNRGGGDMAPVILRRQRLVATAVAGSSALEAAIF